METEGMSRTDLIALLIAIREYAAEHNETYTVQYIDKMIEGMKVN